MRNNKTKGGKGGGEMERLICGAGGKMWEVSKKTFLYLKRRKFEGEKKSTQKKCAVLPDHLPTSQSPLLHTTAPTPHHFFLTPPPPHLPEKKGGEEESDREKFVVFVFEGEKLLK